MVSGYYFVFTAICMAALIAFNNMYLGHPLAESTLFTVLIWLLSIGIVDFVCDLFEYTMSKFKKWVK